MLSSDWRVQVLRQAVEPETRWLHRHILRRRWRTRVLTIFSGPLPTGSRIERHMNRPSILTITDASALLYAKEVAR